MSLTAVFVTFGVIFLAELPDKTMVASLVLGSRYRPSHVWVGVAAAFAVHVTLAVAAGSVITLLPGRVVDVIAMVLFALGAVLVYREGREEPAAAAPAGEPAAAAEAAGPDPLDEAARTGRTEPELPAASQGAETPGPGTPTVVTPEETAAVATLGGTGTAPRAAARSETGAGAVPVVGSGRGFWQVVATSFGVVFVAELGDLTQISTANLAARFGSPVSVWIGAVLGLWTVAAIAIVGGRSLLRVVSIRVVTRIAAAAFVVLAVLSLVDVIRG